MCRITYICPATKIIGLSNLEHLVNGKPFEFSGVFIGDIIKEAVVIRVDQGKGVVLQVNDKLSGFSHVSFAVNVTIQI